jgi:prephenate dehydrogenase
MKSLEKVAIVGVGLIGGSIGLALRERGLAKEIAGFGRRASTLERAKQLGAITSAVATLTEAVAGADFVVVCTPVETIVPQILEIAAVPNARPLITDAGSTKSSIVAQLEQNLSGHARFVGSHPLAGSERGGIEHARVDLFQGRVVVVTPTSRTDSEDVAAITDFWIALGARVISMPPDAHDRTVATTSHAPHVVASALAAATDPTALPLTAGGWRDSTRIAGGDPELWQQILLDNRTNVLQSLSRFETSLSRFRSALEAGDSAALRELLQEGKTTRDALGS